MFNASVMYLLWRISLELLSFETDIPAQNIQREDVNHHKPRKPQSG